MRTSSSATERLSATEIEAFLNIHIPYRLKLLHLGLAVAPAFSLMDSAMVEAAIVAGRQLIYFLGLNIEFQGNDRPVLISDISYMDYGKPNAKYTDEVKIVNVGGAFIKIYDIPEEHRRILAEFLQGASKSTAHLTEGSGHKLNDNGGEVFSRGCELILKMVSDALPKPPRP